MSLVEKVKSCLSGAVLTTFIGVGILGVYDLVTSKFEDREFVQIIDPQDYEVYQHDADQVFRDHNGYRILYANKEGLVEEVKYLSTGGCGRPAPLPIIPENETFRGLKEIKKVDLLKDHVKVYKDLKEGEKGYVRVIKYISADFDYYESRKHQHIYAEIHLPQYQKLDPGNEKWGGKNPIHDSMKEVK